jgi:hypothetical protein
MVLPTDLGKHPTDRQRQLMLHVMAKVWGIFSPREFQVWAIAQLLFHSRTCLLFLIQNKGEGKSAVVLTSATLLRGICLELLSRCSVLAVIKLPRPRDQASKLNPITWMRIVVKISCPFKVTFCLLQTGGPSQSFYLPCYDHWRRGHRGLLCCK